MKFRNFLLSALDPTDLAALSPVLSEVSLERGHVIAEPETRIDTIYFPSNACISVVTVLENGKAVETCTVGCESAAGLLDAVTGHLSGARIFAQVGGSAIKLEAGAYRARMLQSPALMKLTLLHARANALQAERGVACNIVHEVEGRLARWLLMTQDRIGADSFPLTQDYMAVMTGVQRSTVSTVAAGLKHARIIDYSRGSVAVRNRAALEARACECYAIIRQQFNELGALVN